MPTTTHLWNHFKAKVCIRFGSLRLAAAHFECSEEALRMAVTTEKCGRVRAKLEKENMLGLLVEAAAN